LIASLENLQRLQKYAELNQDSDIYDSIHKKYVNVEDINDSERVGTIHMTNENKTAYIQFSSGSTGNPQRGSTYA
jgi:acyl-coenzyme A synthetase/AMP-(fatty) acid ligase